VSLCGRGYELVYTASRWYHIGLSHREGKNKEAGMTKLSKLFLFAGLALILIGVFLRITLFPVVVTMRALRPISFIIAANASLLLAILFKK
jgi:hypothetical protein